MSPLHRKTVGIHVSPISSAYMRDALRAIVVHARRGGHWRIIPLFPSVSTGISVPHRLDGLIGYLGNPAACSAVRALNIPVVNLSSHDECDAFACVWPDNAGIGRTAAETLMRLGLRHFAYLGYADAHFSRVRFQAFRAALAEREYACTASVLPPGGFDRSAGRRAIRRWLQSLARPCGLFVVGDTVAFHVIQGITAAGLRVPDDIAVLSVDNEDTVCDVCHPTLSSIPLPAYAIGAEAACRLDRMMRGTPVPAAPCLLPALTPVLRESTRIDLSDDPRVSEAMRRIRDQAAETVADPDEIARQLGITRRTLDRRFRNVLHRTPKQAADQARLEHLQWMLHETDETVKRIATDMGFSAAENMARFFRRMTGLSPSAFRKMRRNARGQ